MHRQPIILPAAYQRSIDNELTSNEEFTLDLETLEVEELEQRLELQSIGVLFDRPGPGGGGTCGPNGCGWR